MPTELYRRFRPKSLKRMLGNEETVSALRGMLKKGEVPHTLLFSGPSGCGKTTLARIVASELKAHEVDIVEKNCSAERGIDFIRDIQKAMNRAPSGGECRVWILDEVHQLTKEAQNAALKMWEDTPDHVYFFLATTDPQKLLPTIRTRCSDMPVVELSERETTSLVKRVSNKVKIELNKKTLRKLVELSHGSARLALVLLDKIRHIPEAKRLKAMQDRADEENVAIDLCRALIKRAPWKEVGKILRGLKADSEGIRYAVLGYARNTLLSSGSKRAYSILRAFENNTYDTKDAGIAIACFEALNG